MVLCLQDDTPLEIRKYSSVVGRGPPAWTHPIKIALGMLAHCAPASSIAPIILTVLEVCVPNWKIVKALPSINWIRQCRTLLVYVSKTLAAMKLDLAKDFKQLFMDGTYCHQTPIQNDVVSYLGENGYETISVDKAIIEDDESAQCCDNPCDKVLSLETFSRFFFRER
jgi:hypothetical protein